MDNTASKEGISLKPRQKNIQFLSAKKQNLILPSLPKGTISHNLSMCRHPSNTPCIDLSKLSVNTRASIDDTLVKPSSLCDFIAQALLYPPKQSDCVSNNSFSSNTSPKLKIQKEESAEEEEEEQYEDGAMPGPGAYENRLSEKKSMSRLTNLSFLSKQQRFRYKEHQQVPYLNIKSNQECVKLRREVKVPFGSTDEKKQKLIKESTPSPFQYNPRIGIEESLIRNMQKNIKGNLSSHLPRFIQRKSQSIGPGYYSVNAPQQEKIISYIFSSKQKRFQ